MPKEYKIPPPEGPTPRPSSRMRIFTPTERPIEIGSLERNAFDYLGNIMVFPISQGYGLAYRLGTKENLKDDEDDPVTAVFHFKNLVAKKGRSITPELEQQMNKKFNTVVQLFTIQAQQRDNSNILSIGLEFPPWMMKELEEKLQS